MSLSSGDPPVTFPRNGTPPDADGYPHYAAIGEANEQFIEWYKRELQDRRRARQALLEPDPDVASARARWAERAEELCHSFARCPSSRSSSAQPPLSDRKSTNVFCSTPAWRSAAMIRPMPASMRATWAA